jgi:hypothetical protein
MIPYSASDIVRTMRDTYGIAEVELNEDRPRAFRWIARLIRRR